MKKLHSERILNKKQLHAIGCVAVESSRLETLIEILIWIICGFDEDRGRIFTDRVQLDGKVSLLRALVKEKKTTQKFRDRFKEITDEISSTIPKRNTIIHGDWLGVPKSLRKIPTAKVRIATWVLCENKKLANAPNSSLLPPSSP